MDVASFFHCLLISLEIKKRGSPPLGGGEVQFLCPIVKQVKTLNFVEPGKVKRIRGIAYVRFPLLNVYVFDEHPLAGMQSA